LVAQLGADPPSLNTIVDSDWSAAQITEHRVYESLVEVDPYDHPQYRHRPALAERWEISPDQKTYTFYLRRDVRFHDGTPFTARDVVATFEKVQDPTTKAMHVRAYTQDIESFEALDEFTVRFRLRRPYFLVMDGIFVDVPIQPAHVISKLSGTQYNDAATNPLNRHPVGTGPFRFESWVSNQRISLVRNERYYRRAAYLDRVVFRVVKEAAISLELAERQELDIVTRIRAEQWVKMDPARFRSKYHRQLSYDPNYAWIGYNQARAIFQEKAVRRAMTKLVNRPGIISALQYGLARPTTCHFFAESDACDPSLLPLPYDPAAAVKELEAAGWVDKNGDGVRERGGQPLRFGLMIPAGSEDVARMATLLKESFAKAGVDMYLSRVEWSAFVRRLRDRDFDACTLAWSNGSPRSDPAQIWHSASVNGGSNYIGFRNPRADDLIERARSELDDTKRNGMYRELGRILHDEQPYTWLYTRPRLALIHRRVHGVRDTITGFRYEDLWVDGPRRQGHANH
jgi:peptide/nickel transport system substrate-binding protein